MQIRRKKGGHRELLLVPKGRDRYLEEDLQQRLLRAVRSATSRVGLRKDEVATEGRCPPAGCASGVCHRRLACCPECVMVGDSNEHYARYGFVPVALERFLENDTESCGGRAW